MCDTERQLAAVFVAMMTEYVTRKDMQWQKLATFQLLYQLLYQEDWAL